jgi:zinc transporter 9
MTSKSSKGAVIAAIVGNTLVMIAKFVAFFFTMSGAMLSEAIHTLADVLNQVLLLVGIVRSDRMPDERYAYGYNAERYVWALISAVGIFFLGCGVTIYHGISSLVQPHELHIDNLGWPVGVLVFSFLIEGYVLLVAIRAVQRQSGETPLLEFLRNEADPAVVAVVLEDSAACLGVLIALVTIVLARFTGHSYWDAVGSIMIGVLLGAIACWLIWRNSQLLVGASVPQHIRAQVAAIIRQNPAVEEIIDLKTRVLDTDTYRIKADIRFDGEVLAEKLSHKLRPAYEKIKSYEEFREFAREFADEVVELLADEIDAIENRIKLQVPKARHLDIEAD